MGHFVHKKWSKSTLEDKGKGAWKGCAMTILDASGQRKYLTQKEVGAFLEVAERKGSDVYAFSLVLSYTGARISEALALTKHNIDLNSGVIVIETLKKRRRGIYRSIPVPNTILEKLIILCSQTECSGARLPETRRLWPWCRTKAWTVIKRLMNEAGIVGPQATARGLRHSLAVGAIQANVPLNIVQRWMGHSRLTTTAIYADAVGEEERRIAERYWASLRPLRSINKQDDFHG